MSLTKNDVLEVINRYGSVSKTRSDEIKSIVELCSYVLEGNTEEPTGDALKGLEAMIAGHDRVSSFSSLSDSSLFSEYFLKQFSVDEMEYLEVLTEKGDTNANTKASMLYAIHATIGAYLFTSESDASTVLESFSYETIIYETIIESINNICTDIGISPVRIKPISLDDDISLDEELEEVTDEITIPIDVQAYIDSCRQEMIKLRESIRQKMQVSAMPVPQFDSIYGTTATHSRPKKKLSVPTVTGEMIDVDVFSQEEVEALVKPYEDQIEELKLIEQDFEKRREQREAYISLLQETVQNDEIEQNTFMSEVAATLGVKLKRRRT